MDRSVICWMIKIHLSQLVCARLYLNSFYSKNFNLRHGFILRHSSNFWQELYLRQDTYSNLRSSQSEDTYMRQNTSLRYETTVRQNSKLRHNSNMRQNSNLRQNSKLRKKRQDSDLREDISDSTLL